MSDSPTRLSIPLTVDGVSVTVSAMHRPGPKPAVLFLHGFGSTKEDYWDTAFHPLFADRTLIAYDVPGAGESTCADLSAHTIPFLHNVAEAVLDHFGIDRFHLVGHSMGGLTALKLATSHPDRILSFGDIEGNVAPEDCFLSRQIVDHPSDDPDAFLREFAERLWRDEIYSHPIYASTLSHKIRASAVAPIFRSMVQISDNEPLMEMFTGLPCPKAFIYGAQNRHLSYLGHLLRQNVQLIEIEKSGHFPMYANAQALWARLGTFIAQAELEI